MNKVSGVRCQKPEIGIRPPAHRGGAYAPAGSGMVASGLSEL
jgi:hypothetical protein